MTDIFNHWQEITIGIGGIVSFFAGRKSKKTEEKSAELQNIEKVREMEKQLLLDMEEQITKLIETNNKLELIIENQSKTIRAYEGKYGHLK